MKPVRNEIRVHSVYKIWKEDTTGETQASEKTVQNLFSEDRVCECNGFMRLGAMKVTSDSTKTRNLIRRPNISYVRTLHCTSRPSKWQSWFPFEEVPGSISGSETGYIEHLVFFQLPLATFGMLPPIRARPLDVTTLPTYWSFQHMTCIQVFLNNLQRC